MFYDNNIIIALHISKFRLNLNSKSFFIVKNVSKSCKKGASLTPAVDIER